MVSMLIKYAASQPLTLLFLSHRRSYTAVPEGKIKLLGPEANDLPRVTVLQLMAQYCASCFYIMLYTL